MDVALANDARHLPQVPAGSAGAAASRIAEHLCLRAVPARERGTISSALPAPAYSPRGPLIPSLAPRHAATGTRFVARPPTHAWALSRPWSPSDLETRQHVFDPAHPWRQANDKHFQYPHARHPGMAASWPTDRSLLGVDHDRPRRSSATRSDHSLTLRLTTTRSALPAGDRLDGRGSRLVQRDLRP